MPKKKKPSSLKFNTLDSDVESLVKWSKELLKFYLFLTYFILQKILALLLKGYKMIKCFLSPSRPEQRLILPASTGKIKIFSSNYLRFVLRRVLSSPNSCISYSIRFTGLSKPEHTLQLQSQCKSQELWKCKLLKSHRQKKSRI